MVTYKRINISFWHWNDQVRVYVSRHARCEHCDTVVMDRNNTYIAPTAESRMRLERLMKDQENRPRTFIWEGGIDLVVSRHVVDSEN